MARRPLIAALACAVLAAAVYVVALHVSFAQRADIRLFDAFVARDGRPGTGLAPSIFNAFDPMPFAIMLAVLVVSAILAGRGRAGIVVGLAIFGAALTAELLKHAIAAPRPAHSHSWPSGHTTAVLSLVLGLMLLSPPRWRPLVAAGGVLVALAVIVSMLLLGSHYPSDVIGGVFLAGGFMSLALAVLSGSALAPRAARRSLSPG